MCRGDADCQNRRRRISRGALFSWKVYREVSTGLTAVIHHGERAFQTDMQLLPMARRGQQHSLSSTVLVLWLLRFGILRVNRSLDGSSDPSRKFSCVIINKLAPSRLAINDAINGEYCRMQLCVCTFLLQHEKGLYSHFYFCLFVCPHLSALVLVLLT